MVAKQIFVNPASAQNWIRNTRKAWGDQSSDKMEFPDFLNVFVKGIVKAVVVSIAETVKDFTRSDAAAFGSGLQNAQSPEKSKAQQKELKEMRKDKTLLWRLAEYKREQLLALLEKGMIKTTWGEKQKRVKR